KPQVETIEGIPPAIAIDQTNPVRTSRSTVGTMTELNDHLKLLFARAAKLHCRDCGKPVVRDTPASIFEQIKDRPEKLVVTFPIPIPKNFSEKEVEELLQAQGYTRLHSRSKALLEVVQDRFKASAVERQRVIEALEAALKLGQGKVNVYEEGGPKVHRFSSDLHCADCDIHYAEPTAAAFSFNSPIGACEACRGFGRVIGVDFGLVVPNESLSLKEGTIRPWQTASFKECQDDLVKYAKKRKIPLDVPFRDLDEKQKRWVLEGEDSWQSWKKSWPGTWYGVRRFFKWLESKAYKMHIRVLLSKYRAYTECTACKGTRLKPEASLWTIEAKSIHDLMLFSLQEAKAFFEKMENADEATELLLAEIQTRLRFLCDVGLGYLTLDRQSRTLSGGEVQRINLTTALGTSLVNTLFVLDEPSIGLHPRDMGRVIDVMKRLRDAGNSLVVVEHDPQIMFAADRILDMGPGPGEKGGEIAFFGSCGELKTKNTLTAEYLSGRKKAVEPGEPRPPRIFLTLEGASEHNLKGVDVRFPLERLVCVTGVSGSGKSTLVQDVLYRALLKAKGLPTEAPGAYRALRGAHQVSEVVMVDQSAIGKTTRSNPASYVGAFDVIRDLFAKCDTSRERGYTAGTFSFNSGNGRCPACGGNGFEHVEMQFLSDVYLRCPDCDGRRYRAEVLEAKIRGKSIADVLDMTIAQALLFFARERNIADSLRPLVEVGLDYLKLGQPVPTLSGGEAQRLKLAGHLAEVDQSSSNKLFLFDEPTTGLHFDDVAKLMRAFRRLLDAGHSIIVIEHNLDVMRGSDWIIDLGPEGGAAGGELVCEGTPEEVKKHPSSHTGKALREYESAFQQKLFVQEAKGQYLGNAIRIHKAREHNLKNIDVDIPRGRFTVVTGVSGSGKSTLAFDILFNEGQRRYLESLNAYARQFVQAASRPDVDAIFGIPPTVAIEQRTSRGGRKSTVGTLTEVHHFLRLLFVKLGTQYCPDCEVPIEPQNAEVVLSKILKSYRNKKITLLAPLVLNRKGVYTDLAKWAYGKGHAYLRVDGKMLPTRPFPRIPRFKEHTIELPLGEFVASPKNESQLRNALRGAIDTGKGVVHVLADDKVEVFSTKRACRSCGRSFPELDPRLFSYNSKHGWCPECFGTGLDIEDVEWTEDRARTGAEDNVLDSWIEWLEVDQPCAACEGKRLNREALAVLWNGKSIADYSAFPILDLKNHFNEKNLKGREAEISRDLIPELKSRLGFLEEVGLGYLTLDRSAPTLSGGEAQRIRLAAQLGSNLRGVCYILDEPTIGLHHRDNQVLLDVLGKLEAKGNSLVVVEHDEDTIRRAEHVIDLGPGAGRLGGEVTAQGSAEDLMANPQSLTGKFLKEPLRHPLQPRRPVNGKHDFLEIQEAKLHNLKKVNARIPLGRLVVVTGVSGSGKSTLARDVLYESLAAKSPVGCKAVRNQKQVERVLEVDQTPIGKTPRSCPATYVGFWDNIRKLFADTAEARMRGWTASRFSFNAAGGRCEACEGQGVKKIEMSFLPDVKVACEACGGARFNPDTLTVKLRGKSAGEVLAMSVDDAVGFFTAHPSIHRCLTLLQDVGLGYLTLGQQSPTLSGGEAQRIKLVYELAKKSAVSTVYVLDEPTVGLHMADVEKLIRVLHRLVDAGNTAVVIEHNLDVIAEADWIVDLGPEGGSGGGRIVFQGPPEKAAAAPGHTAHALAGFLAERSAGARV
ncbi:MAG: excinuclease ABC subunit UvrA, partial [Betaproteobacteria bacterium]|nr:excinuclease ABC subunit UvrA [Betaproteobacteria bacterium]